MSYFLKVKIFISFDSCQFVEYLFKIKVLVGYPPPPPPPPTIKHRAIRARAIRAIRVRAMVRVRTNY